jgi:ATP-GRASP peptide maturase of grasp-with-spasm system
MILILTDRDESSTCEVIDWLLFQKQEFIRIHREDKIDITISNDPVIHLETESFRLSEITAYWYRRGYFDNAYPKPRNTVISRFMESEEKEVNKLLHFLLKEKKHIGSLFDNYLSKLEVLHVARKFEIRVPDTLITSRKEELAKFTKDRRVITKSITNSFSLEVNDTFFFLPTVELTDLWEFPERFSPILVQELLDKKYELRIFYLEGKFYSSVIFSQSDPQTALDFRHYNSEKPNRVCPFQLPTSIADKLTQLMNHFQLKSGSIDMVVTKAGEYVFLEVNPIGQFKQVSEPCNYYLEEKICNILMNKN